MTTLNHQNSKGIIDEYETFIEMASKQFPTFALWSTYFEITGISVSMYANPDTFMYNTLFRKFNIKESQLFSFSKLFDYETQTRVESICLRNQFFLSFLSYNPVESHASSLLPTVEPKEQKHTCTICFYTLTNVYFF